MSNQALSEINSPGYQRGSLILDINPKDYPLYLHQSLGTNTLYDPSVTNGLGSIFNESENMAQKIISKIINDGGNILYDSYLQEKMNDHSINRIVNLIEYVQKLEYLFYDDINENVVNNGILDDTEPLPSHLENWKGLCIAVEKPQPIPISKNVSQRDIDQGSVAYSRKCFQEQLQNLLNIQDKKYFKI